MGIVMTAFSFAAVAGVPLGIWLGTTFDWRAPFVFIVVFAIIAGYLACKLLKPLQHNVASGEGVLEILLERQYWYSFGFTVALMMGGFTVIPYISPFLVSNLGFSEGQLAYFYLTGGAATLVSARIIGGFSDRIGKFKAFVWVACLSMIPILLLTHLRPMPMLVIVIILAVFMVFVSGRFIPAMALMSMGVVPHQRGRFMSVNTSVQQFGSGLAALVSGAMLSHDAAGHLSGYNRVGYLAVAATVIAIFLASRVERLRLKAGVSH
jgi:predicted MFS family arabinose efflux permease